MGSLHSTGTTMILLRARQGDRAAVEELFPRVYEELRALAQAHLRRERAEHTLQPTALIHEAYLKLIDKEAVGIEDRTHFFAVAARSMRQILIDHARARGAQKRGGDQVAVTLDDALAVCEERGLDVIALGDALDRLAELDPRKAKVVELRFFGGLTTEEAAGVLGVSPKTAEADWYVARAWLRQALSEEA